MSIKTNTLRLEDYRSSTEMVSEKNPEPLTVRPLDQFKVPEFPMDAFPPGSSSIKAMCREVSEKFQVPIDLPAMLAITIGAAACSKKFSVHICGTWTEPLNLYTALVMEPSNRKSPTFKAMNKPIVAYETQVRQTASADSCPQILIDDCTPEALATLLSENDGKVFLLSDEGGMFSMMKGLGNTRNSIDVYSKAWDGGLLRINRKTDDPKVLFIEKPALTIGVAVQPEILKDLTLNKRFQGRGLVARFLYSVPESRFGTRRLIDTEIPKEIIEHYYQTITNVLQIPTVRDVQGNLVEQIISFSKKAQELISNFHDYVEIRLSLGGEFAEMREWAGKLLGQTARIAAIWHCLIHSTSEGGPSAIPISSETVEASILLARDYLIPHAQVALLQIGNDPIQEAAKKIMGWVRRTQRSIFSERDIYVDLRRSLHQSEINLAMDLIVERDYVTRLNADSLGAGRKPTPKYKVNSMVETLKTG